MRRLLIRALTAVVVLGISTAGGCGERPEAEAPSVAACPEGTTQWSASTGFSEGTPAETRDEAVRRELESLRMKASKNAIAAAVIASSQGAAGTEEIVVPTSGGVDVTMTLAPLDPGWGVERSEWCAPTSD